jgi:hypothetical protein
LLSCTVQVFSRSNCCTFFILLLVFSFNRLLFTFKAMRTRLNTNYRCVVCE